MQPQYTYHAYVTNVVDGDTVDAVVHLGFMVTTMIRFRLNGVDTKEMNSVDENERLLARQAKEFVTEKLKNQWITLQSYKTDKYGRWLADIYLDGTTSINQLLLENNLAVPYDGRKR